MTQVAAMPRLDVGPFESNQQDLAVAGSTTDNALQNNPYAVTKEEEWITKKRREETTTKQIETRVKRHVLLEDGLVVEDSGPIVTTNTTHQDTQTKESQQTEHRTMGGDEDEVDAAPLPPATSTALCPTSGLLKQSDQVVVKSHEERKDILETEDVQHLGTITDKEYISSVAQGSGRLDLPVSRELALAPVGPRVVRQSNQCHRVVDTERTRETKEATPDGKVVTQIERTVEREEVGETEDPDDPDSSDPRKPSSAATPLIQDSHRESTEKYIKTKDEDFVEYLADGVKVGEGMRFVSENVEVERTGAPMAPLNNTTNSALDGEWDSVSTRIRRMRRPAANGHGHTGGVSSAAAPTDRQVVDFEQEEETRKLETNKWLEHHFGSKSTLSSRDSAFDFDDEPVKTSPPVNGTVIRNGGAGGSSFINVTMKSRVTSPPVPSPSPPAPTPPARHHRNLRSPSPPPQVVSHDYHQYSSQTTTTPTTATSRVFVKTSDKLVDENLRSPTMPNAHFQGVSDWSERTTMQQQRNSTHTTNNHQQHHLSSHHQSRAISPVNRIQRSSSPPPRVSSPVQVRVTHHDSSATTPPPLVNGYHSHSQSQNSHYQQRTVSPVSPRGSSPPHHRQSSPTDRHPHTRSDEYRYHVSSSTVTAAPASTTSTPPPAIKPYTAPPPQTPKGHKTHKSPSRIGESFRRLVERFRSASSERKRKAREKKQASSGGRGAGSSRSPSPRNATYQAYHAVDSHLSQPSTRNMNGGPNVTRFYLGEDPWGASIYGREKEYPGVSPVRRRAARRRDEEPQPQPQHHQRSALAALNSNLEPPGVVTSSSTLGRFSKSTSRLLGGRQTPSPTQFIDYSRTAQTLPRKLRDDSTSGGGSSKKQVYIQREQRSNLTSSSPSHWSRTKTSSANVSSSPVGGGGGGHASSMINVSIVNTVGPTKPARTYRSSLARSKSFNVHELGEPIDLGIGKHRFATQYKSNPKLDETPAPLKSPGILASISRSQRDLTSIARTPSPQLLPMTTSTPTLVNGHVTSSTTNTSDTKRSLFLRGLMDRAPELFRTLHGDEPPPSPPATNVNNNNNNGYTNGYSTKNGQPQSLYSTTLVHSPGATKTVVRRGSDDYTETVRYSSKSDDPHRPTVTNTVQSFSKKKIPRSGGMATETIESSETTTVTTSSSRRRPNTASSPNGGVVIEVRPPTRRL